MPKIFPIVVKKTTVVQSSSPTATIPDTVQMADPQVLVLNPAADTVQMTDPLVKLLDLDPELVNHSESFTVTLSPVAWGDTVQTPDGAKAAITGAVVTGDTWLDQASAGTTHGSATTVLAKGASTAPGSDERRAYFMFDLSKYAGCSGDPNAANGIVFNFNASTSNALVATTLTINFRSGSTQPFVEATATWTNSSATLAAYGTSRSTQTKSIATGAAANYSVGLSPSQATSCLTDGWLLITFTTAGGAAPDTVTTQSREAASNFPTLTLNLIR